MKNPRVVKFIVRRKDNSDLAWDFETAQSVAVFMLSKFIDQYEIFAVRPITLKDAEFNKMREQLEREIIES